MAGVVPLLPALDRAGSLKTAIHEIECMLDHRAFIVAIGEGNAWDRQSILVALLRQRHAIMLVREHLPHHLQTNRMVVAVHLIHQPLAPQAPRSSEFLRPCDRQWSLTHVDRKSTRL